MNRPGAKRLREKHMTAYGILLCDDLIFSSRICGEAAAQGIKMRSVKTDSEVKWIASASTPRCVIVDLNCPGLQIAELVQHLVALQPKPTVVGYGSHVDTATLEKARDAGCDVVWPRSKFVQELAVSLPVWFGSSEEQS